MLLSQEQCPERSEINIVCEKVAYEGVTRFEDRCRALYPVILTSYPMNQRPLEFKAKISAAWLHTPKLEYGLKP